MARRGGRRQHNRRSLRVPRFDYALPGAYFVTIVAQGREPRFGRVVDGVMRANPAGRMVMAEWHALSGRFPAILLDAFVLMPDHVHGIVGMVDGVDWAGDEGDSLVGDVEVEGQARAATTLGDVVGAFKSRTTVQYAMGVRAHGWPPFQGRLWQRNYHEHVIRSVAARDRLRRYIANNPARFHVGRRFPDTIPPSEPPGSA